jgi:hypothetical protein
MFRARIVRPLIVGVALLTIPTACFGKKGATSSSSGTTDTTIETVTAPTDGPRPATAVEPCMLSSDEVKKATGLNPAAPGEGNIQACIYQMTGKGGAVGKIEVRAKPWVTDKGIIEGQKRNFEQRVAVDLPTVGLGAIVFEGDAAYKEVPGFVMTKSGLVSIVWTPGTESTKDDTKIVEGLAKAIAKKLENPATAPRPQVSAPAAADPNALPVDAPVVEAPAVDPAATPAGG